MMWKTRGSARARLRRSRVRPAEGRAREALEPVLVLRVRGGGLELEMEVRAGRVAGLADEADRLAGGELAPCVTAGSR